MTCNKDFDDFGEIGDYVLANSSYSISSIYVPQGTSNGNGIGIPSGTPGGTGINPGGGIITSPNITWPSGTISTGTYTYGMDVATYTILKLPRKKMPEKVFVQGLLKTCGLLGTDAECAYTGKDVLVFAPNVIPISDPNILTFFGQGTTGRNNIGPTISIEYHNTIYHYVVDDVPVKGDKSTVLNVRQISMIKKGK